MARIRLALVWILVVALVISGWLLIPRVVEHYLFPNRESADAPKTVEGTVPIAQKAVRDALPAAGLSPARLVHEERIARQDSEGSWEAWSSEWRLDPKQDPSDVARRVKSLSMENLSSLEFYTIESDTLDVEVRVYAEGRLACTLLLQPTLPEWPERTEGAHPLFSIVIRNCDKNPAILKEYLELPLPIAFALDPFSPFTLRMARDAVTSHKEVIVAVEPDQPLNDALQTVPHASGLLVSVVPLGAPGTQAQAIKHAGYYILDLTPGGLPTPWIRALQDAGVPHLRGISLESVLQDEGLRRFRHAAARQGQAVLVLDLGAMDVTALSNEFREATARGFRPSFVAEVSTYSSGHSSR
jgi:hypothetical protein